MGIDVANLPALSEDDMHIQEQEDIPMLMLMPFAASACVIACVIAFAYSLYQHRSSKLALHKCAVTHGNLRAIASGCDTHGNGVIDLDEKDVSLKSVHVQSILDFDDIAEEHGTLRLYAPSLPIFFTPTPAMPAKLH